MAELKSLFDPEGVRAILHGLIVLFIGGLLTTVCKLIWQNAKITKMIVVCVAIAVAMTIIYSIAPLQMTGLLIGIVKGMLLLIGVMWALMSVNLTRKAKDTNYFRAWAIMGLALGVGIGFLQILADERKIIMQGMGYPVTKVESIKETVQP